MTWYPSHVSWIVLGRRANRFDARRRPARSASRLLIRVNPAPHNIAVCIGENHVTSVALAFHFNGDGLARHSQVWAREALRLPEDGGAICSNVHCLGDLSGRQRTKPVPCRKRSLLTWSYRTSTTSFG